MRGIKKNVEISGSATLHLVLFFYCLMSPPLLKECNAKLVEYFKKCFLND